MRTLYHYLGKDRFFAGLQAYFTKFAYGCTRTEDLWQCLEEASGMPVSPVIRNFVHCNGFPFVALSGSPGAYTLSAGRFIAPWARSPAAWPDTTDTLTAAFLSSYADTADTLGCARAFRSCLELASGVVDGPADTEVWNIPLSGYLGAPTVGSDDGVLALQSMPPSVLTLAAVAAGDASLVLQEAARELSQTALSCKAQWVKLNATNGTYYRTVYDGQALQALITACAATPRLLPVADVVGMFCSDLLHGAASTVHYLVFLFNSRYHYVSATCDSCLHSLVLVLMQVLWTTFSPQCAAATSKHRAGPAPR